ncbi:MAG TPA: hypothetical protein VH684_28870 [Xanthobacteraceae bacterium]|jgi:hypothetical protein
MRSQFATIAAALACLLSSGSAQTANHGNYPNWKGQWTVILVPGVGGQNVKCDPTKPWGFGQQAPLTPEYQKVLEASMADQAAGGVGNYPSAYCMAGGMPRMMSTGRFEYVITPETTYILVDGDVDHTRRIFTDGRPWPASVEPTYAGYSIGRWIDRDGDGSYDVLEVETRNFKGPRAYDGTGLPLHFDNQSIFKERFYLDTANPNVLHNTITVIDHALTRPWTVDKTYRRNPNPRPSWREQICAEGNVNIVIGKENYFLSADGFLMPARKDQPPPDSRYFKQTHR